MAFSLNDPRGLDLLFGTNISDLKDGNIKPPRGSEEAADFYNGGKKYVSPINKLHIIKLVGDFPYKETDIKNHDFFKAYTAVDLCKMADGAVSYDIEDFLYCKHIGVPINRLITLRRFPTPCLDNIYDTSASWQDFNGNSPARITETPDIARMVTYMTNDTNKLEEVLAMSYALKWKELTSDMEQATIFGEQSGVSGFIKKIAKVYDATTGSNYLSGRSTGGPMSSYDPKFDQNRVYGPVDSINETNIRDIGLEFNKEFEITFDYELRAINGRTPEYAMKDILANVIACTFNSGKFWPGARYWVGERPSPWAKKLQWMNSGNIDTVMAGMFNSFKSTLKSFFGSKEGALNTLKRAVQGGFAIAMSKLLDGLGRPGIPAMNSLLSADPTGEWHLMVGNPHNPILSIGNLICTGTDIKFPTDALSYGDFPTKMQIIVKLKPGMPKDAAGIETIFNHGMNRMFWQPITQKIIRNSTNTFPLNRSQKAVNNEQNNVDITRQLHSAYDFMPYTDPGVTERDIDEGRATIKNIELDINGNVGSVKGNIYDEYSTDSEGNSKNVSTAYTNADIVADRPTPPKEENPSQPETPPAQPETPPSQPETPPAQPETPPSQS